MRASLGMTRTSSMQWWTKARPYVFLGALTIVVWVQFARINDAAPNAWAEIEQIHAVWLPDKGRVQLSLIVDKHRKCRRTVVLKSLRPITNGAVEATPIELLGSLGDRLQNAPIGKWTMFDFARPSEYPMPGHYFMNVSAFCETVSGGEVLGTEPKQALVVVDAVPLRMVPRGEIMGSKR